MNTLKKCSKFILLYIGDFDLTIKFQRFWAANQLYNCDNCEMDVSQETLMNLIHYMNTPEKNTTLFHASNYEFDKVLDALLSFDYTFSKIDPSVGNNQAIRYASHYGHTNVVKLLLLDPRVDPTIDNNFSVSWASRYGHDKVVRLLLSDHRVDPSVNDNYPIRLASEKGHSTVVELVLLDPRVDPSVIDNYPIRLASENGK